MKYVAPIKCYVAQGSLFYVTDQAPTKYSFSNTLITAALLIRRKMPA